MCFGPHLWPNTSDLPQATNEAFEHSVTMKYWPTTNLIGHQSRYIGQVQSAISFLAGHLLKWNRHFRFESDAIGTSAIIAYYEIALGK